MQEHPDHVSLCLEISGCPHHCEGCHSPELQNDEGIELTPIILYNLLNLYENKIDCVIFFGGDHEIDQLKILLCICKSFDLKTCLWTGNQFLNPELANFLDYVKVGPYIKERGPLGSPNTNQKYYDIKTGEEIKCTPIT
jgi:anaerobic ribonucleoside-triphosphate reductase activating protein